MFKQGPENATLKELFAALPAKDEELTLQGMVDVETLLPADRTTYRYPGSLTTPPCTEGVRWHVFAEPVTMSVEQVEAYRTVFPFDARPIQPLNGREVQVTE
jgi:carbonic anhydrase